MCYGNALEFWSVNLLLLFTSFAPPKHYDLELWTLSDSSINVIDKHYYNCATYYTLGLFCCKYLTLYSLFGCPHLSFDYLHCSFPCSPPYSALLPGSISQLYATIIGLVGWSGTHMDTYICSYMIIARYTKVKIKFT